MRHPPAHPPSGPGHPSVPFRRAGGRLAAGAVVLLVSIGWAAPALAHDALLGSEPADGAVLTEAPSQIVLTFSDAQAGVGSEVAVVGPDGAVWSDGPVQVSEAVVTQPLRPDMPEGVYTVTFRSVAGDGHPVSGTFTFSVDLPEAVVTEAAEPAAAAPVTEAAEPAAAAPVTEAAEPATAAPDDGAPARSWLGWMPAATAVLLALTGVVAAVRRRRLTGE